MEFVVISLLAFTAAYRDAANFSTVANVVTSLPFVALGLIGLRHIVPVRERSTASAKPGAPFAVFVLSLILVGAGSIFYHLVPSTEHLLWDRLPIAVCLAAFACAMADTRSSSRVGSILLFPALLVSVSSVMYWYVTASRGHEDLRAYAAVQVGVVLWAAMAVFWKRAGSDGFAALCWALVAYAAGRVVELFQQQIYNRVGLDLGHPLKHLLVALAAFLIVRALASSTSEQTETGAFRMEAASLD